MTSSARTKSTGAGDRKCRERSPITLGLRLCTSSPKRLVRGPISLSSEGEEMDAEREAAYAFMARAPKRIEELEAENAALRQQLGEARIVLERIKVRTEAEGIHWEAHRGNIRMWCQDVLDATPEYNVCSRCEGDGK